MVALTAGTASSRRFRFALMALALDVGAVASFALSLVVAFTSGVTTAFLVLAFPVPLLATLAALAASIRSLSESKERLAKFVASALAVVSGLLLCWWGVVLLALLDGPRMTLEELYKRTFQDLGSDSTNGPVMPAIELDFLRALVSDFERLGIATRTS